MKKAIIILSTILFVSVITTAGFAQSYTVPVFQPSSPITQGTMPTGSTPRYECGYFYQDGLRVTDCFDEFGNFIPSEFESNVTLTDDSATIYEDYAEDVYNRLENPSTMYDFTDDYDAERVYGDRNGVNFVTKVEYSSRYGNYEAYVNVPEIRGMANANEQASLNEFIQDVAYSIIDQFEAEGRAILREFPDEKPYHMVNYDFYVATESESILTLAVEYFAAAGSSYSATSYYNFNKQTRDLILMDDYFIPGSAAANILREEILNQMRRQMNGDENVVYWIDGYGDISLDWDDILATVGNNNQYFIDDDGNLVIHFNKYDVAPGHMGNPEFTIPMEVEIEMENARIGGQW